MTPEEILFEQNIAVFLNLIEQLGKEVRAYALVQVNKDNSITVRWDDLGNSDVWPRLVAGVASLQHRLVE